MSSFLLQHPLLRKAFCCCGAAGMGGTSSRQKETLSSTMMERIRRRLRKTAYRSHIVLQMVPEDEELHSHMHITPLRASRALGIRFVATKFGLDMNHVTVSPYPQNLLCVKYILFPGLQCHL